MATYVRFHVELGGFAGAPGINTWAAMGIDAAPPWIGEGDLDAFGTKLENFYDTLKGYLPAGVTCTLQPSATIHEIGTNELKAMLPVTSWTVTGADVLTQTSRATMAKLRFYTDRPRRNRMLQGGIYFGPFSDQGLDDRGNVTQTFITAVQAASEPLIDDGSLIRLAVFSGPKDELKRPDGTVKFPAAEGETGYVQSVSVMPVPAVLRSRRD